MILTYAGLLGVLRSACTKLKGKAVWSAFTLLAAAASSGILWWPSRLRASVLCTSLAPACPQADLNHLQAEWSWLCSSLQAALPCSRISRYPPATLVRVAGGAPAFVLSWVESAGFSVLSVQDAARYLGESQSLYGDLMGTVAHICLNKTERYFTNV